MKGHYLGHSDYLDSGIKWIGRVPTHWTPLKFKRVLSEKKHTSNPALPAGSISFGRVVYKNSETLAEATKASYQEVLPDEFLVNPLNLNFDLRSLRTALSDIAVVVSTGYIVLRSNSGLNKRFTRWLLQEFDVAHMKTLGAGVRQTINFTDIGNSIFFAPPLEEQTQIAKFLDYETAKMDALIEKQQQLIALLKEKRQAVISHAVTKGLNPDAPMRDSGVDWLGEVPEHWEVCRAKHVASVFIPQRNKPELNGEGGIPWITMDDMRVEEISEGRLFVSKTAASEAGSRTLPAGAVIASCVGNFGVCAINRLDVVINQQLQAFLPERIEPRYLAALVELSVTYFELVGTAATLVYVNQRGFDEMPVLVPSTDEQIAICEHLSVEAKRIDTAAEKATEIVLLLQERRTALISAAVTGKIDVRGWKAPNSEAEVA